MAESHAEKVAEDRHAVLQLLYEAHHHEPCGPALEAISAAIQHLQALDADMGEAPHGLVIHPACQEAGCAAQRNAGVTRGDAP